MFVSFGKLRFPENYILDWTNREQAVRRKLLIEKVIPRWTENVHTASLPAFLLQQRKTRFNYLVTSPKTYQSFWGKKRLKYSLHTPNGELLLTELTSSE